jgi:hypothetical protein
MTGFLWTDDSALRCSKIVQITVRVLHHILANGENLTCTVIHYILISTFSNILENVHHSLSKFLIVLFSAGLSNSYLTYFN